MIDTGLFDKLFHRQPKIIKMAPSLNGYMPMFSQFGQDIYASDVVQQALSKIVSELKKLNPQHIRQTDDDPVPIRKSSIQRILNEPNPLMTTSEFIEKFSWLLLLNYNAFIIPIYHTWKDEKTGEERRYYDALYPIQPLEVDFIEDAGGRLFVKFRFTTGYATTIPYDDVIHIRHRYSINEYMGGNELGQPDNRALLKTLQLNSELLNGVAKSLNASYAVNGILKYSTYLDDEDVQRQFDEFQQKLKNNESGILPIDMKAEFTPLERKSALVDDTTLKFIDEKILRNFGVPLCILTGDFTKEQFEAFYSSALEPLVISISQAFTKKLFTEGEKSFGNRIEFYPKEIVFMTMSQKLEMINILSPTGGLFENEKRAILGLRPLEELKGKRFMSLNWIDAENAEQYQVGNVNVDVVDEEKEEM